MNIKDYCIPVSEETLIRMPLEQFEKLIANDIKFLKEKGCSLALIRVKYKGKTKHILCRKPDESDEFYRGKGEYKYIAPYQEVFASFRKELRIAEVLWVEG